jgi:hypothetical protein
MEFTLEQKDAVKAWVAEGCSLAEVQRRIASELGTTMTYMDVRFLVLDLDVAIKEEEEPVAPPAPEAPEVDQAAVADAEPPPPPKPGDPLGGSLSIEIDRVMKPGALASGTVIFSDGVSATWMLDQSGRLAISSSQPDYRPSEADNEAFIKALQDELAKKGGL